MQIRRNKHEQEHTEIGGGMCRTGFLLNIVDK